MGLFNKKHSVGKIIAELRKEKGWTQVELAEKLQVSDKAVSKWEKDDAFPSVEFFPVLAELFGVSIDYLMTGKAPEKEIVLMSKMELSAKNDDVTLFGSIDNIILENKDEYGKTILDYMLQYNCTNVIDAFFKKYSAKSIFDNNGYSDGYIYWSTDKILELLIVNNKIDELNSINAFIRVPDPYNRKQNDGIFSDRWCKLILTNPNVSKELKKLYFRALTSKEIDEALSFAIDNNNSNVVLWIWECIKDINDKNIPAKQQMAKDVYGRYMTSVQFSAKPCQEYEAIGTSDNYYYFVVTLSTETIQKLLDKGYIEIAKSANEYNRLIGGKVLNEEKIRIAELKKNGGNIDQMRVLDVMQDGVVNIDKLLETKDLKFAKSVLENQPILFIEVLIDWFKNGNWRKMFEYSIDNNVKYERVFISSSGGYETLARHIISFDKNAVGEYILNNWKKGGGDVCKNHKHLFYYENAVKKQLFTPDSTQYFNTRKKDSEQILSMLLAELDSILAKINLCKKRILDDLAMQLDKESTIADLTKEYFYEQLDKGNTEIVIIKLCVRLESVLKNDYHYEGDFSEMLTRYCSSFNTSDDEGNDYNPYTPNLLNKLRMQRNSIVHSEKGQTSLEMEELRCCIEYICKMG